jgi:hypothetical protein
MEITYNEKYYTGDYIQVTRPFKKSPYFCPSCGNDSNVYKCLYAYAYKADTHGYICLDCGSLSEMGDIKPQDGTLVEAIKDAI